MGLMLRVNFFYEVEAHDFIRQEGNVAHHRGKAAWPRRNQAVFAKAKLEVAHAPVTRCRTRSLRARHSRIALWPEPPRSF